LGIRVSTSFAALFGLFATVVALLAIVLNVVDRDRRYQALLAEGDRALAAENPFAAAQAYSAAIGLRPDSMAAHLRRGQAYRAEKRDDDAIRDWQEASRLSQTATLPLELLGDLHAGRGEDAQAAAYYEQCTRLDPGDPERLYKLGLARYRSGSPVTAIEPLKAALAINDNFGEAHYLLALAQRDIHADADAVASLQRAIRANPNLVAAREELADLYRALGRPVDELTQLQALSSLDASVPREIAIAMAETRDEDFDGAIATLSSIAGRSPSDSQIQLALGRVYLARAERTMDRESVTAARTALETALAGTARRADAITMLGRVLYLAGDDEGAERLLREAVSTSPLQDDAFGYLADVSERQHDYEAARSALLKLDALQGDTVPADVRTARVRRLGLLSFKMTDFPAASAYLARAYDAGLRDAALYAALAESLYRQDNVDEAKAKLTEALAATPRDAELLRLRRVIR
jgi:tetratricopeptide (TPR) repeat protein